MPNSIKIMNKSSITPITTSVETDYNSHYKILVVSKSRDTNKMYSTLLSNRNCRVIEARNVRTVSRLKEHFQFNVILMDMGIDFGLELINFCLIKELFKDTPVILASGFSHSKCRSTAFAVGASEYLVKPVNFDQLKNLIEKYTGYKKFQSI